MRIIGKIRQLILPKPPGTSGREIVAPSQGEIHSISRRTFFSFFGVGAVMLAKPDLFLPKLPTEGRWISIDAAIAQWGPNAALLTAGVRREFAISYMEQLKNQRNIFSDFMFFYDTDKYTPAWWEARA